MNQVKKILKDTFKILLITFFTILILDFTFGEKVLKVIDPYLKETLFYDKRSRISHYVFHHTFKNNFNFRSKGFKENFRLCTNQYGFKSDCKHQDTNNYDFGILGDSFTEGIGLNYENTFSGVLERELNSKVANLGVSSYSPKIHFAKLNYYLNKGVKFKHIIIFLDISDYYDDAYYSLDNKNISIQHSKKEKIRIKLREYFPFSNYYFYVIKKIKLKSKNDKDHSNDINFSTSSSKISSWFNDDSISKKTDWLYKNLERLKINKKDFLDIHSETKFYLNEIYNLSKKNNIKFSLAIYPWPHNLQNTKNSTFYRDEWKNFCKLKCDFFFDFFEYFEKKLKDDSLINIYKKYYFWGDVHFNEKGNKFIGKKLVENLVKK